MFRFSLISSSTSTASKRDSFIEFLIAQLIRFFTMDLSKQIKLSIDKKISSLKELIYELQTNQTTLTIQEDREALINACNSLEKYENISNKIYNKPEFVEGDFKNALLD